MSGTNFHEAFKSKKNYPATIENKKENDGRHWLTTETNPRIISMLRFRISQENLSKIKELASQWPFLTLEDLINFSKTNLIECTNIDQISRYVDSWNTQYLDNNQAEKALTEPRIMPKDEVEEDVFTLVPISVKIKQQEDKEKTFDGKNRYLLLHYDEKVLSPGEPTSTRMWLNALLKYYDFENLKVAEVFSGSGPAAVIAGIGGARQVDCLEINPRANEVAKKNYDLYRLIGRVLKSNVWSEARQRSLTKKYDLILANPPFNPKPQGETLSERLIEAVQDMSYQSLQIFLRELPEFLTEDGKAIVLYEDLPIGGLIDSVNPINDKRNAIEIIVDQLNQNENYGYKLEIKEKIRLRRDRGEERPLNTYVVLEITYQHKAESLETIEDHLVSISANELLIPTDVNTEILPQNYKSRHEKGAGYPDRFSVPDDKVEWKMSFPEYDPQQHVDQKVLRNDRNQVENGWADPEKYDNYNDLLEKRERDAYEKFYLDEKQKPLNPRGRTGLAGRGLLGNWGPNNAVDPIITRFDSEGFMRVLVITREDLDERNVNQDENALPGGMVNPGEMMSRALSRELGEEAGTRLNFDDSTPIYTGYVDDPRNTDNAWMVTEVYHKHLNRIESTVAGSDAAEAHWKILDENLLNSMYASHNDFLITAMNKWQNETGLVLRKDGRVGRISHETLSAKNKNFFKDVEPLMKTKRLLIEIAKSCDEAYRLDAINQLEKNQEIIPSWLTKNLFTQEEEDLLVNKPTDQPELMKKYENAQHKLAINLAGFYALIDGLDIISRVTQRPVNELLELIVGDSISEENKNYLSILAHTAWAAGQPFRDQETRDIMAPWELLNDAEQHKDMTQIRAAAEALSKHLG